MAEYLLGKLQEMGCHPAYLSRGYGRDSKGFLWVDPSISNGRMFGDEAFQVANKFPALPVAVCENRVEGVKQMLKERPGSFDILVLDDAFQHLRIHRDLDLLMVDCNRLPWRDLMLPAGNLREPQFGLRRADMFIFSKFEDPGLARELVSRYAGDRPHALFQLQPGAPIPFFATGQTETDLPPATDAPSQVFAFSGLGNNAFFFSQLEERYSVTRTFSFADHYAYRKEDLEKIVGAVRGHLKHLTNFGDALILTTEKDYFRLRGQEWLESFREVPLYYLPARMVPISGAATLEAQLEPLDQQQFHP